MEITCANIITNVKHFPYSELRAQANNLRPAHTSIFIGKLIELIVVFKKQ